MNPLPIFRVFAVRISLMLTMVAALVMYPLLGRVASVGLLMGGIAGSVVFWITARQLEKLAIQFTNTVYFVPVKWRIVGLAIYAAVLIRGYTLDKEHFIGLFAVAAGLFMIRLAVVILGVTGLDLPKEEEDSNG
ncbi:MAG: hypothetical protein KAH38_00270 [Candidatus Hydrogenedentes bacterium]|nr:hypothetical protein [Candidatus Hydrogenedentota bacterium]